MGVDRSFYYGPYAKCKIEMVKKTVSEPGCEKCKKKLSDAAFCPKCGEKVGQLSRTEKEVKVDSFDLVEKVNERLVNVWSPYQSEPGIGAAYEYWIPNVKMPERFVNPEFGDKRNLEDCDFVIPVGGAYTQEEIKVFKEYFAKELAVLKEAYGDYELDWGIIQWFS